MNSTKTILAIIAIVAALTLVTAGVASLSNTALAKKVQVCPGGQSPCNGNSGDNNPNAFCTTTGTNRPNCGNG